LTSKTGSASGGTPHSGWDAALAAGSGVDGSADDGSGVDGSGVDGSGVDGSADDGSAVNGSADDGTVTVRSRADGPGARRRGRPGQPAAIVFEGVAMATAQPQPSGRPESEQRRNLKLTCMSNLLRSSGERVYFKDRMSRFLFVSKGWLDAYTPDRAAEELVGKTDFDVFSEQHATAAFEDEQQIIRSGEAMVGKVEIETFSGREDAWVSTTKMPLVDDFGKIIGTFGITRDVTPQIMAEQALTQQTLQLSAQNERLRELDVLKDEFIALVSHELRTPLTSIIGYVNLLRDKRVSGRSADEFAEVIQRNAQRLLHLVEDLLFLSQTQPGKMFVELRSADLAQIATDAVEEIRPEAERKKISLALALDPVPRVEADQMRIAQMLGNLISNAVKFTPDGGSVEVRLGREDDQAVLAVADTGVGIPVADQDRVFERFFRTAVAKRQVIPGTGLGLTITKEIVEAHGGTITVDSNEGRGSTFRIHLPLKPCPAADAEDQSQAGSEDK
jgi:PAS domain S-box-containing protein